MFLISTGKQHQGARTRNSLTVLNQNARGKNQARLKLVHMKASNLFSSAPVNSVFKGLFGVWKCHTLLPVKSLITVAGNSICCPGTREREFYVTCTGVQISTWSYVCALPACSDTPL